MASGGGVSVPEWNHIFRGAPFVYDRSLTMPSGEKVLVCWPSDYMKRPLSDSIMTRLGQHWHGDLIVFRMRLDGESYATMSLESDAQMGWDAARYSNTRERGGMFRHGGCRDQTCPVRKIDAIESTSGRRPENTTAWLGPLDSTGLGMKASDLERREASRAACEGRCPSLSCWVSVEWTGRRTAFARSSLGYLSDIVRTRYETCLLRRARSENSSTPLHEASGILPLNGLRPLAGSLSRSDVSPNPNIRTERTRWTGHQSGAVRRP
ncbi:hypothetical protein PENSPDRAFT_670077 [Peniophora sp. CONT]|nr:hypothetical protein PENSPDRAFT_670077 [Peniophora sp. CONT]